MGRKRKDGQEPVPEGHIRWIPDDHSWVDKDEPRYESDYPPGTVFKPLKDEMNDDEPSGPPETVQEEG